MRYILISLFLINPLNASFSDVFSIYGIGDDKKIEFFISGTDKANEPWNTRNIIVQDLDILRTFKSDKAINMQDIFDSYSRLSPFGLWMVEYSDSEIPVGLLRLDCPRKDGIIEISHYISPEFEGFDIGTRLLAAVIEQWAPVVQFYYIKADKSKTGKCFKLALNKPIQCIYLATNPFDTTRPPSLGFIALQTKESFNFILRGNKLNKAFDWHQILEDFFLEAIQQGFFKYDTPYAIKSMTGEARTISMRKKDQTILYHWIYALPK